MALADYEKRGSGSITPSASLATAMSADGAPVDIVLSNYVSASGNDPEPGWGVMIDGEILRVNTVAMPLINVSRGCADTVPARHAYGKKVWFFTAGYGTDDRQYAATINLGVKVLMKSTAMTMEPKNAPPVGIKFNQRFARPYPPGKLLVNGISFADMNLVVNDTPGTDTLNFTWAHRDRITQGDTLQGHEIGNIGPEAGTTYTLRAYTPEGVLVKTFDALTGTSLTYPIADIRADFGITDAPIYDARFTLESVRDGFTSWQKYTVLVDIMAESAPANEWDLLIGENTVESTDPEAAITSYTTYGFSTLGTPIGSITSGTATLRAAYREVTHYLSDPDTFNFAVIVEGASDAALTEAEITHEGTTYTFPLTYSDALGFPAWLYIENLASTAIPPLFEDGDTAHVKIV